MLIWDEFEDVSVSKVREDYRKKLVSPVIERYRERLEVFKDFSESPRGVGEGDNLSDILKRLSKNTSLEHLARQDYVETLLGFEKVMGNPARMEEYLEGILLRTAGGKRR